MRTTLAKYAVLFALAFCPNRSAWAQDAEQATDDLDLVKLLNVEVSTATKTSESLDAAPAVITVVTVSYTHLTLPTKRIV